MTELMRDFEEGVGSLYDLSRHCTLDCLRLVEDAIVYANPWRKHSDSVRAVKTTAGCSRLDNVVSDEC